MRSFPLLSFAIILLAAAARADDIPTGAPDEAATRKQVDALIKQFQDQKSKATLGMVQQAIDLSIHFGAPSWNDGDHDACCNFYIQTAQALVKAFPDEASATPLARGAIQDLKTALAKVKDSKDADANAWAMRFAFDKTAATVSVEAARAAAMVALGRDCLRRGQIAEAREVLEIAAGVSREFEGIAPADMPAGCRLASVTLADACFGGKKYPEAAIAAIDALRQIPELATVDRDMTHVFGDPTLFDAAIDGLKAEAVKSPKDAGIQFLLGYEYFYSGKKASARTQFEKVLEIDKANAAAKEFLRHIPAQEKDNDPSRQI